MSMTSRHRLRSNCYSSHARAKWVHPFLLTWVDSNFWVQPGPPFLAYHQLKEQTDQIVYVTCGSAYHAYPSSFYPNEPEYFSLAQTFRFTHQHHQVWCQLWCQYVVPISPKLVRHILSSVCNSPDVSLLLICWVTVMKIIIKTYFMHQ